MQGGNSEIKCQRELSGLGYMFQQKLVQVVFETKNQEPQNILVI